LVNGQEDYPDRLQQIWETGAYVQNLLESYRSFPAPTVKGALSEMGVIESPGSAVQPEDREEKVRAVIEIMQNHGDREA
jgi:hypothetical protein